MKSILLKLFIIGLCVSFFPIQAIAGGYTGWRTIAAVEQRECVENKGFQITFSPAHDNPDSCSSNTVVELSCSLETYNVNVAVILTAFATGQEVRAWVSGCDAEGQAKLKSIQSRP
jgi:hypothetical protein